MLVIHKLYLLQRQVPQVTIRLAPKSVLEKRQFFWSKTASVQYFKVAPTSYEIWKQPPKKRTLVEKTCSQ